MDVLGVVLRLLSMAMFACIVIWMRRRYPRRRALATVQAVVLFAPVALFPVYVADTKGGDFLAGFLAGLLLALYVLGASSLCSRSRWLS